MVHFGCISGLPHPNVTSFAKKLAEKDLHILQEDRTVLRDAILRGYHNLSNPESRKWR
jgi:hypothetical protein